jgi:leader peptidase (prepilin peptidase)/N-methyltransferase
VVDVRVDRRLLAAGSAAVAAVSLAFLPWPAAALSTLLGGFMIAGADVDARTFLLPDCVTLGALACGIAAAAILEPFSPWLAVGAAAARAAVTASVLWGLRLAYHRLSGVEGLGRGDIKLSAAVGAWLPAELIPICFGAATAAALAFAAVAHLRGRTMARTTRLPLGAFLCPALWLVFFASVL